ncbi:MAG: lactate racemase domain-containing protein [Verrucomicrobiota bacterium]
MSYPIHFKNEEAAISDAELHAILDQFIDAKAVDAKRVLILPPDITRFHSRAGDISAYLYRKLKDKALVHFLPALGTHVPMTDEQIDRMFGSEVPHDLFFEHDWRNDVKVFGQITSERMLELSEGKLDYTMDVAANKILEDGIYDLIVSIGQIVPHEVIGMANYTKNVLIGTGGLDTINKSHFLGAVYGMERIMGRIDSPVRRALNEGFDQFLGHLPIEFILTVVGSEGGKPCLNGVYCGPDEATYVQAAKLSQKLNLDLLDKPIKKAVVYLDPEEFKTTWLGNKAVYRTRMAMADEGELIILAPELERFGEDLEIDALIRKFGYRTTDETLAAVKNDPELGGNLSAAAHLIHGTSEGRFTIRYCPGEGVTREDVESVGFEYGSYAEYARKYDPGALKDGWNEMPDGEEVFYVSNPALGLWSVKENFS